MRRRAESLERRGERHWPQQTTVPLLVMPQVRREPASTSTKGPPGGVPSPEAFDPQQVTLLSFLTPHAWLLPTLTELNNNPCGGLICPLRLMPQHITQLGSVITPHV